MEFVMFLTMLLFTGTCTAILVVAAFHLNNKGDGEKSLDATTEQTNRHSRKTLV